MGVAGGGGARAAPAGLATVDPFDVESTNRALAGHGLVYGAGIGRFGKPQFFVGALEREERRDGVRVLVAGREHARDLSAAPAASRDGTIYVRTESLRRWLWERAEAWMGRRADGSLRAALDGYGFADARDDAIARMADAEVETLILHELGECAAGRELGPAWEGLLGRLTRRRAELFVRAVRDHLADCLVTLPALLDRDAAPSLHFWFANLQGTRQALFPRLPPPTRAGATGEGDVALRAAIGDGAVHWQHVCTQVLEMHNAGGEARRKRSRRCPPPAPRSRALPVHFAVQAAVSEGTLPTSSRKFPNGPMLPIASILGPSNPRRPNIIAAIGPYSPFPISIQRVVSAFIT